MVFLMLWLLRTYQQTIIDMFVTVRLLWTFDLLLEKRPFGCSFESSFRRASGQFLALVATSVFYSGRNRKLKIVRTNERPAVRWQLYLLVFHFKIWKNATTTTIGTKFPLLSFFHTYCSFWTRNIRFYNMH